MKNKLIAFGTAALLVTSLAACGESSDKGANDEDTQSNGTVVVEEEEIVEMSGVQS